MTANDTYLTVKFFALVREQIGAESASVAYRSGDTMATVKQRLIDQGEQFAFALSGPLVMACNQSIVDEHHGVGPSDEIAFFPPVTGG